MHKAFAFPIECRGLLFERWENVKITGDGGNGRIGGIITKEWYDPFDYDTLIPEFVNLYERLYNGENIEKNIKKWHSTWGPLYSDYDKRTLDCFFEEMMRFYELWTFYRSIANKDFEEMKKRFKIEKDVFEDKETYYLSFFPKDDLLFEHQPPTFSDINEHLGAKVYREYRDTRYNFQLSEENAKNLTLETAQLYSMMFLFRQIENYTARVNLSHGDFSWILNHHKEIPSEFKMTPVLDVENLIDAIYLQFFMLFSENKKKICVTCNRPFVPERKDRKYCSDTCYLTAKSRRYRAKKA